MAVRELWMERQSQVEAWTAWFLDITQQILPFNQQLSCQDEV
jgi:hypothetical protein